MPTYIHNGKEYWYSDEGLEDVKAWANLSKELQEKIYKEMENKQTEDSDANL
jgi:hypothetical protein